MTVRETTKAKAGRYLLGSRLRIIEMRDGRIRAVVTGDTGTWRLGYDPRVRAGWYCLCPARVLCSHLIALKSVAPEPVLQGAT